MNNIWQCIRGRKQRLMLMPYGGQERLSKMRETDKTDLKTKGVTGTEIDVACPRCNGIGYLTETVGTLVCCGNTKNGDCCGHGVIGQETDVVQCQLCMGTGRMDKDDEVVAYAISNL